MLYSRYIRFDSVSGEELRYGEDWGVYEFPDGQIQIWFAEHARPYRETVCLNHPSLLDLVRQTADVCGPLSLFVTYLYGARSDKATSGDRRVPNIAYSVRKLLREVSHEIRILNPHDSEQYGVGWAFPGNLNDYDGIVYPDASAKLRQPWLRECGLSEVIFDKVRDQKSGQIIGLAARDVVKGKLLVVDDICDGGATFMKVASQLVDCQLDLCVTHGIFSGMALERLGGAGYDQIYTTNSYVQHDIDRESAILSRCNVTDIWRSL